VAGIAVPAAAAASRSAAHCACQPGSAGAFSVAATYRHGVSSGPSLWRLLHPKWLLLHLFVIASCYAMVRLGHWQWIVAHRHHGSVQNYSYAFQWWAFSGFAVLMWFRVVRDWRRRESDEADAVEATAKLADQPARYVGYQAPARPVETDSERVRFNAYLAQLEAKDREETR
jgi:DNA-binding transcriptional regulator of glucitol operon